MAEKYIDPDNGSDSYDGTTATFVSGTTGPWATLEQFLEVSSPSAGDRVRIRRGSATTISVTGSDLVFVAGTLAAPIVIESDYDDVWGDYVTLSNTATFTFGSVTVTIPGADETANIAVGDWIFNASDDDSAEGRRNYAYEVRSRSFTGGNTVITLWLPFRGTAGSSKSVKNMLSAPIWNPGGAYSINTNSRPYNIIRGIHFQSGDTYMIDAQGESSLWKDCICDNNYTAGTTYHFRLRFCAKTVFEKIRCVQGGTGPDHLILHQDAESHIPILFTDSYLGALSSGSGAYGNSGANIRYAEFRRCIFDTLAFLTNADGKTTIERYIDCDFNSITSIVSASTAHEGEVYIIDGRTGLYEHYMSGLYFSTAANRQTPYIKKYTGDRSGGGNVMFRVKPIEKAEEAFAINRNLEERLSILTLTLRLPASASTVTVYVRSDHADWSSDSNPTAAELVMELGYRGVNDEWQFAYSTDTVDFKTDSSWQALTVTVTPNSAGLAVVRIFYAKNKQTGSNTFYIEGVPWIS